MASIQPFAFCLLLLCLAIVVRAKVNGYCDVDVNHYESSKKYNNKGYTIQCQGWGEECRNKVCPFPKTTDTESIIANCSEWSTCRCQWGYAPTKSTDGRACGMTKGMVAFIILVCIFLPLICISCCCFFVHASIVGVVGIGVTHIFLECYRTCCMDKEAANQARIRDLEAQEAQSGHYGHSTAIGEPLYDSKGNVVNPGGGHAYNPLAGEENDFYRDGSAPPSEAYVPPAELYDNSGGISLHGDNVSQLLDKDSQVP
jgi:hypothetical protein